MRCLYQLKTVLTIALVRLTSIKKEQLSSRLLYTLIAYWSQLLGGLCANSHIIFPQMNDEESDSETSGKLDVATRLQKILLEYLLVNGQKDTALLVGLCLSLEIYMHSLPM